MNRFLKLIAVFILVIIAFIGGMYYRFSIGRAYDTGAANFDLANSVFFKNLAEKTILIHRLSNETDQQFELDNGYTLRVVSLLFAQERNAYGYQNHVDLRNGLTEELGSYLVKNGQGNTGLTILHKLSEICPDLTVDAWDDVTIDGDKVFKNGDVNATYRPISIQKHLEDCVNWAQGNPSRRDVILDSARQFEWRMKSFSETTGRQLELVIGQ